jgi:hypothetical protein
MIGIRLPTGPVIVWPVPASHSLHPEGERLGQVCLGGADVFKEHQLGEHWWC